MSSILLDKLFDPFSSVRDSEADGSAFCYDAFDKLRVECNFHSPENLKKCITNSTNKFNIMYYVLDLQRHPQ